jgi:hypothetical protein
VPQNPTVHPTVQQQTFQAAHHPHLPLSPQLVSDGGWTPISGLLLLMLLLLVLLLLLQQLLRPVQSPNQQAPSLREASEA